MGASDTADPTTVIGGGNIIIYSSNQHLKEAPLEDTHPEPLTEQDLRPVLQEAVQRWITAGADPATFQGMKIQIVDLPRSGLGLTAGTTIWLDQNGAGYGWFIDC